MKFIILDQMHLHLQTPLLQYRAPPLHANSVSMFLSPMHAYSAELAATQKMQALIKLQVKVYAPLSLWCKPHLSGLVIDRR